MDPERPRRRRQEPALLGRHPHLARARHFLPEREGRHGGPQFPRRPGAPDLRRAQVQGSRVPRPIAVAAAD
jgi:hypothetical protein